VRGHALLAGVRKISLVLRQALVDLALLVVDTGAELCDVGFARAMSAACGGRCGIVSESDDRAQRQGSSKRDYEFHFS